MKRKTKAIYSNANTFPFPSPSSLCILQQQLLLIHLKTLLLNEESIFQMRISVMRVALSMKTFLTIVCRVAMRQRRGEARRAQNSNNVAAKLLPMTTTTTTMATTTTTRTTTRTTTERQRQQRWGRRWWWQALPLLLLLPPPLLCFARCVHDTQIEWHYPLLLILCSCLLACYASSWARCSACAVLCSLQLCTQMAGVKEEEEEREGEREIARVAISLGLGRQKVKRATRRMRYINYDTIG